MSMQIRLTSDGLTNLLIGTISAVQGRRIWKMMMQQFELQRRLPLSLPTATFKINQHEEGVRPGQRGDLKKQKGRKGYKHTHKHTCAAQICSPRACLLRTHLQCLTVTGELETLAGVLRAGTGGWFSFTSFDGRMTVLQIYRDYSEHQQTVTEWDRCASEIRMTRQMQFQNLSHFIIFLFNLEIIDVLAFLQVVLQGC